MRVLAVKDYDAELWEVEWRSAKGRTRYRYVIKDRCPDELSAYMYVDKLLNQGANQ